MRPLLPILALACVAGVVLAPLSATASAATTCRYPADVLDLTHWKETLPTGSAGYPDEVAQPALATFARAPWFTTTTACDGVAFRAAVNGVTTSGSTNPRSELRESDGDEGAAWSAADGTHTMTIDEAVTHLPNGRPYVVAGQVHDGDDDVTVFRIEGSRVYVTRGDDTHYALATDSYRLGTRFQARFVASGGKIRAYYDGKLVATVSSGADDDYFKAGAYTQANCGNSSPCSADNYGEVVIHALAVTG